MVYRYCHSLSRLSFPNQKQNFNQGLKMIKYQLGLIIALFIIGFWLVNTLVCLHSDLTTIPLFWLLVLILGQTFLNTGIFITAHDGMHGLICPFNNHLNNFIASVAVTLYGLFPFQKFKDRHLLHHGFPATPFDPDYHDDYHANFFSWYGQFMRKYMSWWQLSKLSLIVLSITYVGQISWLNLVLGWGLPLIFSSFQLFTFGTFFPHRQLKRDQRNTDHIHSLNLSPFWSFIVCYNFGYHWEHHQYPHLPWWKLTAVKTNKSPDSPDI